MKRIAVATLNGDVSEHFGHCKEFTLYTIEDGAVTHKVSAASPVQGHGALPLFLKEQGVELVIVGGMGPGAKNGLNANGIEAIIGASGDIDTAVEAYLKGNLKSEATLCDCHGHHGAHGHGHGHEHGHAHGHGKDHTCSCND